MTGTVLAQLALTVLVYSRTGSPLLAALVFSVGFLPHLLSGTLLSALVDRVPTRRLLVWCNVISAAVALAMALPGVPVAGLLMLAFAIGLVQPVFLGARAATLPDVLPGDAYVPGRSLIRLVAQTAQVAGFAVSGVLLTVVPPQALLVGDAVSFGIAALVLRLGTLERVPSGATSPRPSLLRDSLAGLGDVMRVPRLRRIVLIGWAAPALAVAPEALAVPYAASISAGSVGGGLMLTAIPLGTVVGEVLTNRLASPEWQVRLMVPGMALTFLPLLYFAVGPGIHLAIAALFIAGMGNGYHLGLDRVVLAAAPPELRSRALSIETAGLMFWNGVGFGVAGATAEILAPTIVVPVAGVCGLLAVLWYGARESSLLGTRARQDAEIAA